MPLQPHREYEYTDQAYAVPADWHDGPQCAPRIVATADITWVCCDPCMVITNIEAVAIRIQYTESYKPGRRK